MLAVPGRHESVLGRTAAAERLCLASVARSRWLGFLGCRVAHRERRAEDAEVRLWPLRNAHARSRHETEKAISGFFIFLLFFNSIPAGMFIKKKKEIKPTPASHNSVVRQSRSDKKPENCSLRGFPVQSSEMQKHNGEEIWALALIQDYPLSFFQKRFTAHHHRYNSRTCAIACKKVPARKRKSSRELSAATKSMR